MSLHTEPTQSILISDSHFNRLLPREIKEDIFALAISEKSESWARVWPHILLTVCKEWQHAITTTPTLWTSFEFENPPPHVPIHVLLHTYCTMSGDLPLSISFQFRGKRFEGKVPELLATLRQLEQRKNRLRSLGLGIDTELVVQRNVFQAIQGILQGDLPILEELYLNSNLVPHLVLEMGGFPNLRRLEHIGCSLSRITGTVGCSNVTDLALGYISVETLLRYLTLFPHLVNLRCGNIHSYESSPSQSDSVILLSTLASMQLGNVEPESMKTLLQRIRCPALRSLEIYSRDGETIEEDLEIFLNNSRCPLETLKIFEAVITEDYLWTILDYVQSTLKIFYMGGRKFRVANGENKQYPMLLEKMESATYLPQLQEIWLCPPRPVPVNYLLIIWILHDRPHLRKFSLDALNSNSKGMSESDAYFLHELMKEGREIGICCNTL